ncbi:MAG: hypothetical protein M4579_002588 [Chaenotheca gracillima]|nr:MAG: hypothetical protein M4579_002588 [Chaenotheca gracillima]
MPPRIPRQVKRVLRPRASCRRSSTIRHASSAAAVAPAPPIDQTHTSVPPISRFAPSQPPSHRPPEFRKSQLHRQYTSLLRSTPLMLIFQNNNLNSQEWMGIRRELAIAFQKVDEDRIASGREPEGCSADIKIQTIQTAIFSAALRVVDYYRPELDQTQQHPTDPRTNSSVSHEISNTKPSPNDPTLTHSLSRAAHDAVMKYKYDHALAPLMRGPLSLVTFPTVSPPFLKAALSILSPNAPRFPAPSRRLRPGYHEPAVQNGIHKLMLLGARIEGKVFDSEGARWVGTIDGGMDELRAQLVATLQGAGSSLSSVLEGAGKSLYFTVDGRRSMLEEEENGGKKESE